jgi:hypothetical protein
MAGKLFTYVRLSPTKRTLVQSEVARVRAPAINGNDPMAVKQTIVAKKIGTVGDRIKNKLPA